ncbi:MAG: ATP-dependent DNA helicase, partial [Steroidobacteraceae bacterium]
FAYLVPALLSGRRIIVSTGTRALQDQLYHRDLPLITRAIGRPVRVALLKGRANYLCRHRLELAEQQAYARGLRREGATALPQVRDWSFTTRGGDVGELPGVGEQDPVWPWVTSTRENCLGAECPKFDDCFVLAARREAQAADIVVVNHYLLMADLVLKEEGFGDLLPGADAIVIDEAHQLPDVAAQFLGYNVSTRQLGNISKDIAGELLLAQQMAGKVDGALAAFDAQIAAVLAVTAGQESRIDHAAWPERLLEALNGLGARSTELAEAIAPLGGPDGQAAFTRLRERLEESAQHLRELTAEEAPGGVRWAETTARNVSAHYAPVDVARELSALMEAQSCAWVLTSATLAVGEDFSHFKRRSGLARAHAVRFESPFDFANQALMYLPKGLGEPGAPGHSRDVIRAALPVLEASGGRAFLLFTSHRGLREGAEELYRHWGERPPFPVLIQGGASRDQLLRAFREAGNAVLLGTGSFWEGID